MVALQTGITFQCLSSKPNSKPKIKVSLSSNLKIKSVDIAAAGSYANNTLEQAYVDKIISDNPTKLQPNLVNNLIEEMGKELEVIYNKLTATELAIVTSVVQLESQHLAQLAKGVQKLTGARNVRIKTVLDPTLVAGFTIRYGHSGSKLIDMSVKKQLDEIAAQLHIRDIQLAAL